MRLSTLLASVPAERLLSPPEGDPVVRGVVYDSRAVASGDLFVALRGANFDGHAYLRQALELGAVALMVEELPKDLEVGDRSVVVVDDSRRALAPVDLAIANWRGYGSIERDGVLYGQKAHSLRELFDLPSRTAVPFELALAIHEDEKPDIEALDQSNWNKRLKSMFTKPMVTHQ